MLLRGANGVGYTNYPDNVVQHFVSQAAERRHRPVPRLRLPELGREHARRDGRGASRRASSARRRSATPATSSTRRAPNTTSNTMSALAKELEAAGAHILAVKDMAGLLKPAAARVLFKALREATDLPIHFHTHDTSGLSAATVLAAVEAGVDAVDAAMDALSGNTSQPCLGSLVEALRRHRARSRASIPNAIRRISFYWEAVRNQYARLRERPQGAGLGSLSARDAGRPVHQPQGAGALARAGDALARGGAGLSRRQPDVRRHRQGDAVVQGGRRHGADDGQPGPDRRRCREPGQGHRLPGFGRVDAARRPRPVAGRLAARRCRRRC